MNNDEDICMYGSRRHYLMMLLYRIIGISNSLFLSHTAIASGAVGHMIFYFLIYVVIGIPVLYMELIISQFTGRDCIDVWKARACLSHVGYFMVLWQVIILVYNHTITTFAMLYLLITFENPIPYYTCGPWASQDCNILAVNYSVNQDCVRTKEPAMYCENLHTTFPEYQFWRYNVLGGNYKGQYQVAWKACLASLLICSVIYLNCFKGMQSIKWFIYFFVLYPVIAYLSLMISSMQQKGVIVKFEEAIDSKFEEFPKFIQVTNVIEQVLFSLGVGSGVMLNLGSRTSFRSPVYANTVIAVLSAATFTLLCIGTLALMSCPYSFEYVIKPINIMGAYMSLTFEKIPRMLSEYSCKTVWLIVMYSCQTCLGISTDIVLFFTLLDLISKRYETVANHTSLSSLLGIIILFSFNIPLLGSFGIKYIVSTFRRFLRLLSTFMTTIECLVFVVWYGIEKFSEDVHFMQGIQPRNYMKMGWLLSTFILAFVFCTELYTHLSYPDTFGPSDYTAFLIVIVVIVLCLLIFFIKLIIAACQNRFLEAFTLDCTWGPRSLILQRSRGMFTAHAMTKEYMYRQYHLQAGITARQKRSNKRVPGYRNILPGD